MPQINVTIDDVNPLISYEPAGAWKDMGPKADGLSSHFFDQTRTETTVLGATASLSFYGSAIWLFGAKRADYGNYNVTLDGATSSFNGAGNDTYQTPIFNATRLTLGNHSLSLTNAHINKSAHWVALDYIVWQTEIGQAADTLMSAVIEDTVSAFAYEPHGAWNTPAQNVSKYSNGTWHQTTTNGAYVTFTFSGDSVELLGSVGPAMSEYSVQLNYGKPIMYSATRMNSYNQVPLFFATNLSAGHHTLKVVNVPTSAGLGLSIDYANISGTNKRPPSVVIPSPPSAVILSPPSAVILSPPSTVITSPPSAVIISPPSAVIPSPPSAVTTSHGTSPGTIVAIAVPTAVALLLIIPLCLFLRRRRRKRGINDFEPRPFLVETRQSGGGSLSDRFAGAFQPMAKSRMSFRIQPLYSQLRLDNPQAQARHGDRHQDAAVSLSGQQLPPPDYQEATHSLAA